jgi:hypothetical protein
MTTRAGLKAGLANRFACSPYGADVEDDIRWCGSHGLGTSGRDHIVASARSAMATI